MDPLNPVTASLVVHDDHLHGGQAWSWRLRRGQTLRLTALEDGTCVPFMAWSAEQPAERYNMPDTLKEQFCAYLTAPRVLMTDMGRVLLSITADTCGWHDTITAPSDATQVAARFGTRTYQTHRNDRFRNARDNLLIEMLKHGLDQRDLGSTIHWFTRIAVAEGGALSFVAGNAKRGHFVDLRAEMDTLVALTALAHPLDPAAEYAPKPVHLTIYRSPPASTDDPCRNHRPENRRAFARTEAWVGADGALMPTSTLKLQRNAPVDVGIDPPFEPARLSGAPS